MGMTVDFVDAANSLLSRSFPSNEISHRRLGQFLRHGPVATSSVPKGPARAVQPEKELRSPRPLHHATVAAYESAASPGSSRSLLPPTILQHGSSRSPLQHGSSRRMKLPQPILPAASSSPQGTAAITIDALGSGGAPAKVSIAPLGADKKRPKPNVASDVTAVTSEAAATNPRRPKHRPPMHSASAPALPTLAQKRSPTARPPVPFPPAPSERNWSDAPRAIPAFSFGRAARFDVKDKRAAAQAEVPVSQSPRRQVFGAAKVRVPAVAEAKMLVDDLREKMRANKSKMQDLLKSLDGDGNGELNRAELKSALRILMKAKAAEEQQGESSSSDGDAAGPSDEVMEEVMRFFDLDGTNSVSMNELRRALLASGRLLGRELRTGGAGKLNVYGVNRNALRGGVDGVWKSGAKILGLDGEGEGEAPSPDGEQLLEKMREALCWHKDTIVRLFRGGGDRVVSQSEFCSTIVDLFGMEPSTVGKSGADALHWAVRSVFRSWDLANHGMHVTEIQKVLHKGGRTSIATRMRPDAIFQSEIAHAVTEAGKGGRSRAQEASKAKMDLHGIVIRSREEQLSLRAEKVAPVQLEALLAVMADDCEHLLALFLQWDTDGDGTVGRDEFSAAVSKMGFKFAPQVSDELFSFFDKDDGGSVTLEEIEATLKWGRDRKSARPLLAGWRQLAHIVETDLSLHEQLRRAMHLQGQNPANVFKDWDEDGNGTLDKQELGTLMFALCGMTLSNKELTQLFSSFDTNNNGDISLKELNAKLREEVPVEQLMSALSKPEIEENLFDLFHSSWDSNGDGVLDKAEFAAALGDLGVAVRNTSTGSAFDDLFTMLDEDGSGAISLKELQNSLRWIRSCEKCETLRGQAYNYDGTLSIQTQIRRALAANSVRVMDLFREWDENGDGVLEQGEFLRAMPKLGIHAGKEEIDDLFNSMDTDGDGIVTFKEFNRMMRRENDSMMKDDEHDADGSKKTTWRPKSPKMTLADVVSLRGTVKTENKLRGLETIDITPLAIPKSPAEKGRRLMKKASAAAVMS